MAYYVRTRFDNLIYVGIKTYVMGVVVMIESCNDGDESVLVGKKLVWHN